MVIGVDAGALAVSDERLKLGVYRVTLNLLRKLSRIDKTNTYRLYTFQSLEPEVQRQLGGRMRSVVLPKAGWFSLWLPWQLRRDPPDLFLGLSQAVPRGAPRAIGFVYDLGFFHHPEAYPGSYTKLVGQTDNLVKRSRHIVAISHATADDLIDRYRVSPTDVTVCYPGYDSRFTPTGATYVGKRPYFLFVGALKRGKNVPAAIRAFSEFLKGAKKPYDFFIIGGDYWKDPEIDVTVRKLHLGERVKFSGFVKDDDLPKYYRGAMALVSPSLWEGFCLPVVEAMASGCPVIASSRGSLPEIMADAGILVNPKETEALAKAMIRVIDQNTRNALIAKGKARVKHFSWSRMAADVLKLYEP